MACRSNLRLLGQAMQAYSDAFGGRLPNGNPPQVWSDYDGQNVVLVAFAQAFVKSPAAFRCPSDRDAPPAKITTADPADLTSAR